MRILSNNWVKTSTINPLTEVPGYEFDTALKDTALSRTGRTIDDVSQNIIFDLGSPKAVTYIAILNHNISSGATITIEGNAVDVWTAPSLTQTLTYNADAVIYNFTSAQTYQYWRLIIDDGSNPDGFIELSKVYIGDFVQMPYMAKNQKLPVASTSDVAESNSLQVYGDPGIFYKYGTVNFPFISDAEKIIIDTMFRVVDKYIPVILLVWENDLTFQPPIYSRITNDMDWQRNENQVGRFWTLSFQFKEVF